MARAAAPRPRMRPAAGVCTAAAGGRLRWGGRAGPHRAGAAGRQLFTCSASVRIPCHRMPSCAEPGAPPVPQGCARPCFACHSTPARPEPPHDAALPSFGLPILHGTLSVPPRCCRSAPPAVQGHPAAGAGGGRGRQGGLCAADERGGLRRGGGRRWLVPAGAWGALSQGRPLPVQRCQGLSTALFGSCTCHGVDSGVGPGQVRQV